MAQARAQQPKQAQPELDLSHLAQLIRTGRATPELMESWLETTWREPARFRRALYRTAAVRGEAIKSRPELGLDLYADCIASHLGHQRAALVHEGREITYETLHARSAALASVWDKAGVKAGDSLALLLPVGLDYAVALLAALRLGLCITPIPPLGATYARNRLLLAAADHTVTSERLSHMLPPGSPPPLPLTAAGADATRAASHAYAPTDCVLRLLSPFGPYDALSELDALTLHESLLRDGLLVLSLTAADRAAAPGRDALQLQPLMLLTTWLAGATWVECSAAEFMAKPADISVLGVDTRLRELIREAGPDSCRGVKTWFRSLSDRFDHEKWRTFSDLLAERDIPSFSLLYNAASSGAQLFSPRSLRDLSGRVWPAPGRTFIISQVGADLLPALDATGVYTPLREEEADPSLLRLVLAKLDLGWTSGGSIDIGPEARSLPAAEIAACAQTDPRVGAASLLVLPGRWPNEAHVLLLVFVREPDAVSGELASDLRALIAHELGAQHVPERIEISPLHPRRDEDGIRADWCASQYQSGMLGRKARVPMFLTLSRLAWIFQTPTS
ncbi:MAG TPA: AMP-binding protein [Polyangiales bacterium]|nr:AMP-binding protein [Polyangiales bacterium]